MKYLNIHTCKSYRHLQQKMCDVFAALVFALAVFSAPLHAREIEGDILISKSHSSLSEGVLLGDLSKLDPLKKPSENFDLLDWSLTLPTDLNKDKKADTIYEKSLDKGFNLKPFFYTADDGGLVFACPNVGAKTSKNTKYARTELREMLRRGNGRIKTRGLTKNNWVFSNAHGAMKANSGGIEGSLEGTLAINRVSTTGDEKKVGRVVIGQIHATDDEPIRLYYRKLPGNSKGAIYFAHEINDGDDIWINMIGSRSHTLSDPDDGIALNEKFSYKISVEDEVLFVIIIREGIVLVTSTCTLKRVFIIKTMTALMVIMCKPLSIISITYIKDINFSAVNPSIFNL